MIDLEHALKMSRIFRHMDKQKPVTKAGVQAVIVLGQRVELLEAIIKSAQVIAQEEAEKELVMRGNLNRTRIGIVADMLRTGDKEKP